MKLELGERETTIVYDADKKLVLIFSSIGKDQRKLKKAGIEPLKLSNYLKTRGIFYEVPLTRFKWRVVSGVKFGLSSKTPSKHRGFRHKKANP